MAAAHTVTAVVCQPDRPKGRSGQPAPPPVKVAAQELGIPVYQPEKLNDGVFEAWLRDQAPEVCTITAYGRLLKQPLLDIPPRGYLNVHPSLLPRYRGPSPIQTALLNGDPETGVSIMRLNLEMDAGDLILQERTPIEPDENSETLSVRLGALGATLLVRALTQVEEGTAHWTPQDPAQVTHCALFQKEDGRIRWAQPAQTIHNLVRAANPWPMAHCGFRGEVCRIPRTAVLAETANAAPGTVTAVEKNRFCVATGNGQLAVLEFQAPGKKAMPVDAFLRGARIEAGERFEDLA